MNKEQKVEVIAGLRDRFARAQGAVVVDYRGLTVPEISELRGKLREASSELVVAKNTLTLIASRGSGFVSLEPFIDGPTALAFAYGDPLAPVKVLVEFVKSHPIISIKGGMVGGNVVESKDVAILAKLPGRSELLAQLAGTLNAPITGLVRVLSGITRGLVTALSGIADQRKGE